MKQVIAKVKLNPGNGGFFDPITRVHLTHGNPIGNVYAGMNVTGLQAAVRSRRISVIEGSLGKFNAPFKLVKTNDGKIILTTNKPEEKAPEQKVESKKAIEKEKPKKEEPKVEEPVVEEAPIVEEQKVEEPIEQVAEESQAEESTVEEVQEETEVPAETDEKAEEPKKSRRKKKSK